MPYIRKYNETKVQTVLSVAMPTGMFSVDFGWVTCLWACLDARYRAHHEIDYLTNRAKELDNMVMLPDGAIVCLMPHARVLVDWSELWELGGMM